MNLCNHCKTENPNNLSFCKSCGYNIKYNNPDAIIIKEPTEKENPIIILFQILFGLLILGIMVWSFIDSYKEKPPPEYEVVQEPSQTFYNYECTDDCSGHEAGYNWAEKKGISDSNDCGGNSNSFIEGCKAYVDENY
jgi:hypothetical protein